MNLPTFVPTAEMPTVEIPPTHFPQAEMPTAEIPSAQAQSDHTNNIPDNPYIPKEEITPEEYDDTPKNEFPDESDYFSSFKDLFKDFTSFFSHHYDDYIKENLKTMAMFKDLPNFDRIRAVIISGLDDMMSGALSDNIVSRFIVSIVKDGVSIKYYVVIKVMSTIATVILAATCPVAVQLIALLVSSALWDNFAVIVLLGMIIRFIAYLIGRLFRKKPESVEMTYLDTQTGYINFFVPLILVAIITFVMNTSYRNSTTMWGGIILLFLFMFVYQQIVISSKGFMSLPFVVVLCLLAGSGILLMSWTETTASSIYVAIMYPLSARKQLLADYISDSKFLEAITDVMSARSEAKFTLGESAFQQFANDRFSQYDNLLPNNRAYPRAVPYKHPSLGWNYISWYKNKSWLEAIFKILIPFVLMICYAFLKSQEIEGHDRSLQEGLKKKPKAQLIDLGDDHKGSNLVSASLGAFFTPSKPMGIALCELISQCFMFESDFKMLGYQGFLYVIAILASYKLFRWLSHEKWKLAGENISNGPAQMQGDYFFGNPKTNAVDNHLRACISMCTAIVMMANCAQMFYNGSYWETALLIPLLLACCKLNENIESEHSQQHFLLMLALASRFYGTAILLFVVSSSTTYGFPFCSFKPRTRNNAYGQPTSVA